MRYSYQLDHSIFNIHCSMITKNTSKTLKGVPSDKSHHHETLATLLQIERMQKSQDY